MARDVSCGRVRWGRGLRYCENSLGGTIAVALIAVIVAFIIFRLSKRNPVNSANVNEHSEVTINAASNSSHAVA
ncbi:MAG: hypothetical protein ACLRX5_08550 [Slackia sp.]